MSYRSHAGLHARRLFDVVLTATIFGLVWLLPPAAQAANPAEEMFKGGRTFIDGGIDPHGDSWRSMAHSLEQFLHPEFMLPVSQFEPGDSLLLDRGLAPSLDAPCLSFRS